MSRLQEGKIFHLPETPDMIEKSRGFRFECRGGPDLHGGGSTQLCTTTSSTAMISIRFMVSLPNQHFHQLHGHRDHEAEGNADWVPPISNSISFMVTVRVKAPRCCRNM